MSNVTRYFEESEKDHCVRFIGDKLQCYIPLKYENKGYLTITDKVQTIGIFTMVIDDKITCGMQLPAVISIEPSKLYKETKDGQEYFVCELHKGDKLISTTQLLENDRVGYITWLIYITDATPLDFMDYEGMAGLFDDLKEWTGKDLGANHAAYEMILAHLNRDPTNPEVLWRHTSMPKEKKPLQLSLRSVAQATTSTHAKLTGSFLNDTTNSAMLHPDKDTDPKSLENLFRE